MARNDGEQTQNPASSACQGLARLPAPSEYRGGMDFAMSAGAIDFTRLSDFMTERQEADTTAYRPRAADPADHRAADHRRELKIGPKIRRPVRTYSCRRVRIDQPGVRAAEMTGWSAVARAQLPHGLAAWRSTAHVRHRAAAGAMKTRPLLDGRSAAPSR